MIAFVLTLIITIKAFSSIFIHILHNFVSADLSTIFILGSRPVAYTIPFHTVITKMSENIDEKDDFPILATAKKDVCIDEKERQLCHFLEEESPNFENIRKIISNDVDLKNSISLIVLSSNESLHNQQDFLETFQSLIFHGVNINKQDNHGRNVLHILCQKYGKKNLPSIIRLLIEKKMEINTTDVNGENAIFYLCQNQNKFLRVKVLKILTRHGIQFCHDRCAKKCFRLLKGICAEPVIESLKIWKTRNSMPGWHLNCTDCVNIL